MRPKRSWAPMWYLAALALASIGFVPFISPVKKTLPSAQDKRPLAGSRLVGHWSGLGAEACYRLNITPSILFFTSADESEICEIEIVGHKPQETGGTLEGVVRLDRVHGGNLPLSGRHVIVSYKMRGEMLELSWVNSPELSARFTTNQLIVVRGTKPVGLMVTREDRE
jgi:hypothetical protein